MLTCNYRFKQNKDGSVTVYNHGMFCAIIEEGIDRAKRIFLETL
jgi:hypothetical protein